MLSERRFELVAGGVLAVGRRLALVCVLLGLVVAWVLLMQAAYRNSYIEPTDLAVTRAAAARPAGVLAALVLVGLAAAAAAVSGRRWLAVLGLPGVLAGGWFLLAPSSHGAALMYALIGSVLALVVVVGGVVGGGAAGREAAGGRV